MIEHARDGRFPKGTDVFLFKFQGLFYVAPAQDAFMCRLRLPAGIINSHQFRGMATLAEKFGNGCADVTTRSNLQLREIGPKNTIESADRPGTIWASSIAALVPTTSAM